MRKTKQSFLNSNPRISERQVLSELLVPNPLLAKSVKSMSNETFEPINNLNDDLRPKYHFKSNDARVRFDRGSAVRSEDRVLKIVQAQSISIIVKNNTGKTENDSMTNS